MSVSQSVSQDQAAMLSNNAASDAAAAAVAVKVAFNSSPSGLSAERSRVQCAPHSSTLMARIL